MRASVCVAETWGLSPIAARVRAMCAPERLLGWLPAWLRTSLERKTLRPLLDLVPLPHRARQSGRRRREVRAPAPTPRGVVCDPVARRDRAQSEEFLLEGHSFDRNSVRGWRSVDHVYIVV